MMTELRLWHPLDEIRFMRGLCKRLSDKNAEGYPGCPHGAAERLEGLRKYVALLSYRSFPGWSKEEIVGVRVRGKMLYEKALRHLMEVQDGTQKKS